MTSYRDNVRPASVVLSKACCGLGLPFLAVVLFASWPMVPAIAQSGSAPAAKAQTSTQDQPQTASQPGPQPETTVQTDSGDKQESLGDAARKANAQKNRPKSKHVFTDDDLSGI